MIFDLPIAFLEISNLYHGFSVILDLIPEVFGILDFNPVVYSG